MEKMILLSLCLTHSLGCNGGCWDSAGHKEVRGFLCVPFSSALRGKTIPKPAKEYSNLLTQ